MRTILLADMNSFFASVTQVLEPKLKGNPLLIAGDPQKRHGIILTASYEAKNMGVKTGMAIWEALIYCPQAILRPPDYPAYMDFSNRIFNILRDFSPLIEPFSIDEAFVELTGTEKLWGSPLNVAQNIKKRIKNEVGILCSVGIGSSKVVAKMAAGLQKPDGLVILTEKDIPHRLWPLPVGKLFGVGKQMEVHLQNMGIRIIGDLAQSSPELLTKRFGVIGTRLHEFANGKDLSPVDPNSLDIVKSIGHQITLPRDYTKVEDIQIVLLELAEAICRRTRMGNYVGRTVSLSVRGNDFHGIHRSKTLKESTAYPQIVYNTSLKLFNQYWKEKEPVRLLGLALSKLSHLKNKQLCFFNEDEKLYNAIDQIKDKFGEKSLLRSSFLLEGGVFYGGNRQQDVGRSPNYLP
ncbi:MAG: DNA polymerase IV [Clostridia bacterium]|nr:DNA polymerase IV [Clostridia bacterium]